MEHSDKIVTYPPHQHSTEYQADFRDLALLAHAHDAALYAGYAARLSRSRHESVKGRIRMQLTSEIPDPRALYIISSGALADLWPTVTDRLQLGLVDGYLVGIPHETAVRIGIEKRPLPFSGYMAAHRERLMCIVVKDEATANLAPAGRETLRRLGSQIDDLEYRGSYAAVIYRGELIFEKIANGREVRIRLAAGSMVGGLRLPKELELSSAGYSVGNRASVRVGNGVVPGYGRGFNIVLLNDDLSVREAATWDTCAGTLTFPWFVAGELRSAEE